MLWVNLPLDLNGEFENLLLFLNLWLYFDVFQRFLLFFDDNDILLFLFFLSLFQLESLSLLELTVIDCPELLSPVDLI